MNNPFSPMVRRKIINGCEEGLPLFACCDAAGIKVEQLRILLTEDVGFHRKINEIQETKLAEFYRK